MSLPQDINATTVRVQHTSILPRLVVAPEAPLKGALAFNTPDDDLYYADGTSWKRILDEDDAFLAGDATGPLLSNTVARIRGVTISAVAPVNGQVLALVGGVWTPTAPSGLITLTGDVTGLATANTVVRLQGRPMSAAAPAVSNLLTWNGAAWAPAPAAGVVLGGDVTGPAGTNTVVKIQGVSVSAVAPTPGQVLTDVAGVWTPAPIPPPAPGTSPAHSFRALKFYPDMLAVPGIFTFSGGGATVIFVDACNVQFQGNWYGSGAMASADISGFVHMQFKFNVSWTVASGPTMTCDIDMAALWTDMFIPLGWVGTNYPYFTSGLMPWARNNIGVQGYVNVSYPSASTTRFEWSTGAASLSQEVNVQMIFSVGGGIP